MAGVEEKALHGRGAWRREMERHLEEMAWALEEAERELKQRRGRERQAFDKLFFAWKKAIAATAARLAAGPEGDRVAEVLSSLTPSPVQEERIIVTTGNAIKTLRTLIRYCESRRCPYDVAEVLNELWRCRAAVYQLHTAYYEGAEHAGLADTEEAVLLAKKVLNELRRLYERMLA